MACRSPSGDRGARARARAWLLVAIGSLGVGASAQEGGKQEGERKEGAGSETDTAAERLRKLLRLKKGPTGKVPEGPPKPSEPPATKPGEQPGQPPGPASPPDKAELDPPAGTGRADAKERPTEQDPQPTKPTPKPGTEAETPPEDADTAARLLRRQLLNRPPEETPRDPQAGEQPRQFPKPAPRAAPLEDEAAFPIHGSFSLNGRARWSGGDHDVDSRALLGVEFGDRDRNPVTAYVLGRAWLDLDGNSAVGDFRGIEETYDHNLQGRLYEAYVDVHRVGPLSLLRLGRQTIEATPVQAWFDGARVDSEAVGDLGLSAGAWGGAPTRLFEASADANWIGGVTLGARPARRSEWRLDWMHVDEKRAGQRFDNDLLGAAVWQGIGDQTQLHARYSWLEGNSRDYFLRATTAISDWGLTAQASYTELLSTQRALATEFDPYFASAFDYVPYRQIGLSASQEIGDHLLVSAGGDARRLSDRSDEGQFNREYERFYVSPTLRGFVEQDVSLTLTGEYWDSDGEDFTTFGADVRARLFDVFTTSFGTAYALYKFDSFAGREREHVRTYYARFNYRVGRAVRFDLRYQLEDDDFDRFQTLRAGMTWTF